MTPHFLGWQAGNPDQSSSLRSHLRLSRSTWSWVPGAHP